MRVCMCVVLCVPYQHACVSWSARHGIGTIQHTSQHAHTIQRTAQHVTYIKTHSTICIALLRVGTRTHTLTPTHTYTHTHTHPHTHTRTAAMPFAPSFPCVCVRRLRFLAAVLCCAALYSDVLCSAVLCCAVLCCAVLCYAMLCCAVLCYYVMSPQARVSV